MESVKQVMKLLVKKNLKIAFVESATAGLVCSTFSCAPECGKALLGGLACYDAELKVKILNIPQELIDHYTAESAEVTEALALSGQKYFGADVVIAVTGLAAPGGSESSEKPVGTMFIHIVHPAGAVVHREVFSGSKEQILNTTVKTAADLLLRALQKI